MTEQKKPYPDNKHEARLVIESRPAGIAPSTYHEEDGRAVDMIEIVGEKPRVVRVAQAAYDGMVKDGTEFFRHDFAEMVFNDPPVGPALFGPWHAIGTIPVPAGTAFDLASLSFVIAVPLAVVGIPDTTYAINDWGLGAVYMFRLTIDNVLPWSSYTLWQLIGAQLPGHIVLNEDWLDFGTDCPVHVVATEGQTLRMEASQFTAGDPTLLLPGGAIYARPRARWVPIQHYKRIVGANALE